MGKNTFSEEVLNYYYLALIDLLAGEPVQVIEAQLKEFEDLEMYEACEATRKAIEFANRSTIRELQKEIVEIELELEKINNGTG